MDPHDHRHISLETDAFGMVRHVVIDWCYGHDHDRVETVVYALAHEETAETALRDALEHRRVQEQLTFPS